MQALPVTRVLVDVDCVLADFVGGVAKFFGVEKAHLEANYTPGSYGIAGPLDKTLRANVLRSPLAGAMTEAELWARIAGRHSFWAGLDLLPWAHALIGAVRRAVGADWLLVTAPTRCPQCYSGKAEWVRSHLGEEHLDRYIPVRHKTLLAAPGTLLIDDHEDNVHRFREAGGQALLFPALHNSLHEQTKSPLRPVMEELGLAARPRTSKAWAAEV